MTFYFYTNYTFSLFLLLCSKTKYQNMYFKEFLKSFQLRQRTKYGILKKMNLTFIPSNAHLRVFHNSITEESEGNGEDKVFTILIL